MPAPWGMDSRSEGRPESGRPIPGGVIPGRSVGGIEDLAAYDREGFNATAKPKGPKRWTPSDWEDAMQALFTRLNKGLDFNDPRTQSILNNARNSTMQSANNHGVYGGYSENAAEGSYIKSAAGLQSEQDGMALQALGMGSNYGRGLANDAYGRAMDAYDKGADEAGGLGAGIGGGIGAVGGGIIGFFGGGGPAGAMAGAKAGYDFGSSIGGGIGKAGYNANTPKPSYGGY